jgi:initiation factor 1A
VNGPTRSVKLVVSTDPCELYAIIIKNLGDGMCHVHCIDNVVRLCIIRGKFRGRNKRSNFVNIGSWVLVGKREWETQSKSKMEKCDLMEIYSPMDMERLQQTISVDWKILINNDVSKVSNEEKITDDYVEFTNNIVVQEDFIKDAPTMSLQIEDEEEDINIDDI